MTNTDELRKLLDEFEKDLCHAGCGTKASNYGERRAMINAVKDKYAQAIAATIKRYECVMTEEYIEDMCGEHYVYLAGWTCSECGGGSTSLYREPAPKFCQECGAKVRKVVKR